MRFHHLLLFVLLATTVWSLAAYAQDSSEEETLELLPPTYVCDDLGFGVALPDGFIAYETEDEDGRYYLNIIGEYDQATSIISAEELPEDIIDLAGFWQLMKDRDPLMAGNITYEKIDSIADSGAVLSRVEMIEGGEYILAITWVFVHDGYGFTLSGYPPQDGDNNLARDLALDIRNQFRWMTPEEIAECDFDPDEIQLPEGREF